MSSTKGVFIFVALTSIALQKKASISSSSSVKSTVRYKNAFAPLCGVERTAESLLTNPPGHLWRDKWTAPSGPLSVVVISARIDLLIGDNDFFFFFITRKPRVE